MAWGEPVRQSGAWLRTLGPLPSKHTLSPAAFQTGNQTEMFQETVKRVELLCVKQKPLARGEAAQIWVAPLSPVETHQTDCLPSSVHIIIIGPVIIARLNRGQRSLRAPEKNTFVTQNFFSAFPHFTVIAAAASPAAAARVQARCPFLAVFLPFKSLCGYLQAEERRVRRCLSGFITADRPRVFSSLSAAEWYKSTARAALISSPGGHPNVHLSSRILLRGSLTTCAAATINHALFPCETRVIRHLLLWGRKY